MNSTKERIADAFKDIVCRKSFQKITISDIARECDMTRENFYYHFHDKFDIIRWILENEILNVAAEQGDFENWMKAIIEAFEKEKIFFVRISNEIGKETMFHNFMPYLKERLQICVEASMDKSLWNKRKEKLEFVTDFYSSAFLDLIYRSVMDKEILHVNQINENLEFLISHYTSFVRNEKEIIK